MLDGSAYSRPCANISREERTGNIDGRHGQLRMKPEFVPKPAPLPAPPQDLVRIIGSPSVENYATTGRSFLNILKRHVGLKQSDRVLDVGCGCGRLAGPLTEYLTTGTYDGFDVVPELIAWCQENITPRHANFRFKCVDVANSFYHAGGTTKATQYQFPYGNDAFDLIFLTSVFTHMLKDDLTRYIGEIARTLKPGGTVLMTFFLLNEESRRLREISTRFKFRHRFGRGGIRVEDPARPEGAVAYPEEMARAILQDHGLEVQQILFGSWCGRKNTVSGQDIVIGRKAIPDNRSRDAGIVVRLKRWIARYT
jgi:SAM-dependent methyltransferase